MLIVAEGNPWRTAFSDSPGYAQPDHAGDNSFIIYLGQTKNKNVIELYQGCITRF